MINEKPSSSIYVCKEIINPLKNIGFIRVVFFVMLQIMLLKLRSQFCFFTHILPHTSDTANIFPPLTALLCEQNRFGYDHFGGYERGVGGRGGYADDRSGGRFPHRSAGGYQNGISGMLIVNIISTIAFLKTYKCDLFLALFPVIFF
jgi:hypothetical protein